MTRPNGTGDAPRAGGVPPRPWGAHRPNLLFRAALRASRAIPQTAPTKQLAFLLRRIARSVTRDPVDVTHWGHRLRLQTRGNISESTFLFMPARWDRAERRLLARELGPGAVFVDVGANAGGYTWWVLRLLGRDCTVLAVEPDPALHARLTFNLATNNFDNVQVLGEAVGAEAGKGWLRLNARNRGQNVLAGEGAELTPGNGLRVSIRPLPEIIATAGLPRVDALKLDVEGLEAAILGDFFDRAPEVLWPRLLLVEHQATAGHAALMRRLAGLGYAELLSTRLNVVLRRAR